MTRRWGLGLLCATAVLAGAGTAHAQDNTFKVFWKDGLRFESGDGDFKLKIGGRMQYDAAFFDADDSLEAATDDFDNGTELRRARLELDAIIYQRFFFKTQYDFVDGAANVKDMYLGVDGLPYAGTLKIGQFKEPFSLDELTSSKYDEFMEQALPVIFAPSRNPGIGIQNAVLDERLQYAAGVFMNGDDFGNSEGNEGVAVTARITGLPWYASENQLLHVGLSGTYRTLDDTARFRARPSSHIAPNVVDTRDPNAAIGDISGEAYWSIDPEIAFVYGPFSLQAEYVYTGMDAPRYDDPSFHGYYVYASYWLTGESRNYKPAVAEFDRVKPKRNLLQSGGFGAWQVKARWASIDLEDARISGGTPRPLKTQDVTAGLNWHWNPNMRMMFEYVYSDTEDAGDANIFQVRAQVDF